jgi:hypothetical protein
MPIRLKFPQNIDKQFASQIVVVILFLLACVWIAVQPNPFDVTEAATLQPGQQAGQPNPQAGQPNPQTGQPNPQVAPPDPQQLAAHATAYQLEIENNSDQTTGIVIGGLILVGMVAAGWLLVLNRQ